MKLRTVLAITCVLIAIILISGVAINEVETNSDAPPEGDAEAIAEMIEELQERKTESKYAR